MMSAILEFGHYQKSQKQQYNSGQALGYYWLGIGICLYTEYCHDVILQAFGLRLRRNFCFVLVMQTAMAM